MICPDCGKEVPSPSPDEHDSQWCPFCEWPLLHTPSEDCPCGPTVEIAENGAHITIHRDNEPN